MTIFSIPLYLSIIYVTSYEIPQYLFKKHSIFELLFSFFYVNWLIYKAIIFRASFAMSDKNPPGFFLPCNLMGISFPHTLDRNQRYAYWFPLPWSQRDESSSLAFTASCKIFSFLCGTYVQKGASNDKTTKRI